MGLYRQLSKEEEADYRQWARFNYRPFSEIKGVWHIVVQEECVAMNREANDNLTVEGK